MRDPDRIPMVLSRLQELWEQYPDMRLAQLIGNVYHPTFGADPYYIEDEEFIATLERAY